VVRLPLYARVLAEMARSRTPVVSSERLADLLGINAAKVRKDLSHLGTYGTRGAGYEVEVLLERIGREIGADLDWPVAIVGVGNLGRALANYRGFTSRGFRVALLADRDPAKIGERVGDLVVVSFDQLEDELRAERVTVGIIATPATAAQEVADRLVSAGVGAILNFAPTVLSVPPGVSLRQVDLSTELQILAFYERRRADGALPVASPR
jgi:redox-sensing transcriptional repressor